MENKKRILTVAILTMVMTCALGCEQMAMDQEARQGPKARPASDADYMGETSIVGDEKNTGRGATATAIEWAEKYAKNAQELVFANKRISELDGEKRKLNADIAKFKAEMETYKTELSDANAMLNEMKKDLKEWQSNVLGYRKQMMSAQSAQLSALHKILELLGGEVPASNLQANAAAGNKK